MGSGGTRSPSQSPRACRPSLLSQPCHRASVFFRQLNFSTLMAAKEQQVLCFRLFSCGSPRKTNKKVLGPRSILSSRRCLPCLRPHLLSAARGLPGGCCGTHGAGRWPGSSFPFRFSHSPPPFSFLVIFNPLTFPSTFPRCLSQERNKLQASVHSWPLTGHF